MKALYTASVHIDGGRDGKVHSSDDMLNLSLGMAKELGGGGKGANPEQFFAAGYGACFESAVRHVARTKKIAVTKSSVDAEVDLHNREEGGFNLAVRLKVSLPELDRATAQALLDAAHQVCPYSNATRGNIPVEITLV